MVSLAPCSSSPSSSPRGAGRRHSVPAHVPTRACMRHAAVRLVRSNADRALKCRSPSRNQANGMLPETGAGGGEPVAPLHASHPLGRLLPLPLDCGARQRARGSLVSPPTARSVCWTLAGKAGGRGPGSEEDPMRRLPWRL